MKNIFTEEIDPQELQAEVEKAWEECDESSLTAEINRGRLIRLVRDRYDLPAFKKFLKNKDITKAKAEKLIREANQADGLIEEEIITETALSNFTPTAFSKTLEAPGDVQKIIGKAATGGEVINKGEVITLENDWIANNHKLVSKTIKAKLGDGQLKSRPVADLVRHLEKLEAYPEIIRNLQDAADQSPETETLKLIGTEAKDIATYFNNGELVQTLDPETREQELKDALTEAQRNEYISSFASLVKKAKTVEHLVAKLRLEHRQLQNFADKVYVDSSASTPNTRSILRQLEQLTSSVINVPTDETREEYITVQIIDGKT